MDFYSMYSYNSNSGDHRVESTWSELSGDVVQLIFCKLPEASVLRAGSVCKRWHAVTQMPTFAEVYKKVQAANLCNNFLYMFKSVHYPFTQRFDANGGFVFRPTEPRYAVPTVSCPDDGEVPTIEAAGGLHLAFTGAQETILRYKLSLLEKSWRRTPELPYFVEDPMVGVVEGTNGDRGGGHRLVVAGGLCSCVDSDKDLAVSIFDDQTDAWCDCASLPSEFKGWPTSMISLGAVVHKKRFFVYDMYSGLLSWLDLDSRRWSTVVHLRPSAKVGQMFLVSRAEVLYVVGVQEASERDLLFTVWNVVDELENTIRVGEIVDSSQITNARGAPPRSVIPRWASSYLEICVTVLAVLLYFLLQFEFSCFTATRRAIRSLQGLISSTGNLIKRQCYVTIADLGHA